MHKILESDWKRLRQLQDELLARLCARILDKARQAIARRGRTIHERYREVGRIMKEGDKDVAGAFDDLRRSNAEIKLAQMVRLELLTTEELAVFSPELRKTIGQLKEI